MGKHFCDRKFRSLLLTGSITIVIQYLLIISDTIVIGNILGEQALAAVNVVTPYYSFAIFLSSLLSIGTSVFYSLEMGKFDREKANQLFSQGMILGVLAGVLLFVVGLVGKDIYFQYLNLSEQVAVMASDYFFYYPFGALLLPVYTVLLELVYAEGDELVCNLSGITQMGVNLVSSVLLCFVVGIRGAGMGTLLGLIFSTAVLFAHFFRKQNTLRFSWYMSLEDTLRVLKCGITDACAYLFMGLTSMMASKYVIHQFGEYYLPALLVVLNVLELTIVFDGIGQAVTPLVNVYRGEENQPGVKRVMNTALKFAVGEGVVMTFLLYLFGELIAQLFGLDDEQLIHIAKVALRIVSPFFFCTGVLFLQTTYYMIVEKILLSTVVTGIKDWLVPSICILAFGEVFGLNGVWIGLGVAPFFSIVMTLVYIYLRYGKERFPLLLEPDFKSVEILDAELSEESIVNLRDQAEAFLTQCGVAPECINRAMLFIEEIGMLTVEHNPGRKVCCECSVIVEDDVQIIFRDDGVTFDPTNTDNQVVSLRSYMVANLMLSTRDKRSLVTTGYNRSSLRLEK